MPKTKLEALSEALATEELTKLHATVDRDDVILDKRPKSTSFKTSGRDSQIPGPPNGPFEDSFHRDTVEPRNGRRTTGLFTPKLGHFRLAPIGHAGHPTRIGRT